MAARNQEQREAMRRKIVETQGLSLREAAKTIGVTYQAVAGYRRELKELGAEKFLSNASYRRNARFLKRDKVIASILDAGGTIDDIRKATGHSNDTLGASARKLGYRPCRWLHIEKIAEQYR